jgi:hypothetical protein
MIAAASVLFILAVSLLITRIATVALQLTGVSKANARFQARSAFTGVGYTTSEAEDVVSHPVRRRIVMLLMLLGNVGLVSLMSTVVVSFLAADESRLWSRAGLLAGGLLLLSFVATSKWIDRRLSSVISWALSRWTDLDTRDYANLLHLADGYGVTEVMVQRGGLLDSISVVDAGLQKMRLQVLGVQRADGSYEGAPSADSILKPGDLVFFYGRNREVSEFCAERAKAAP